MDVTDQYPDLVAQTDREAAERHAREAKEAAEAEAKAQEAKDEKKDDERPVMKDANGNIIPAFADTTQDDPWAIPAEMTAEERKQANLNDDNELIIDFSRLEQEKERWRTGNLHSSDELYDDPNSDVIPEETPEPALTEMFVYIKDGLFKKFDKKDDVKEEKGQNEEPITMLELQSRISYQFEAIILEYIDPKGDYEDMVREQFELYIKNPSEFKDDAAWPDMMQVYYPRDKDLKEKIKAEMVKLYKEWKKEERKKGKVWKKRKVNFPKKWKPDEMPVVEVKDDDEKENLKKKKKYSSNKSNNDNIVGINLRHVGNKGGNTDNTGNIGSNVVDDSANMFKITNDNDNNNDNNTSAKPKTGTNDAPANTSKAAVNDDTKNNGDD